MKKIFLVLTVILGMGLFANEVVEPAIETLQEELRQANELKEHYKKMYAYSETEKNLAQADVENYKVYTGNLITNLRSLEHTNEELRDVVHEKDVIINLQLDDIETRDNLLYARVEELQLATERNADLEERTDKYVTIMFIMFISLILAVILFFVRAIIAQFRSKKPVEKKTTKPLKAVKPETKTKRTKTKVTKDTKKDESKEQKADQPSRFSIFLDKRRKAKDLRRQVKLEKRRNKVLTVNKKDEVENNDRIKDNNKGLLGGVMGKFICTIFGIEVTVEDKEPPKKETTKTKAKTTPKTKTTKGGKGNGTKKKTTTKKKSKK